jgi:hypothetical protein
MTAQKDLRLKITQEEYNILLMLSKKSYHPSVSSFVRAVLKKFLEEKKEIKL